MFGEAHGPLHALSLRDLSGSLTPIPFALPVLALLADPAHPALVVVSPGAIHRVDLTAEGPAATTTLVTYHAGPILAVGCFARQAEDDATRCYCVSVGAGDGLIAIRDASTGKIQTITEVPKNISSFAFDGLGGLALGCKDGTVSLYDLSAGTETRLVHTGQYFRTPVTHLAFTGESVLLAVAQTRVVFLKVSHIAVLGFLDLHFSPAHVVPAHDGRVLFVESSRNNSSGGTDGQAVHLITIPSTLAPSAFGEQPLGILLRALQHTESLVPTPRVLGTAAFGQSVVFSCEDKQLWHFHLDNLQEPTGTYPSHCLDGPVSLALTRDAQTLVSGGPDGALLVRDTSSRSALLSPLLAGLGTGSPTVVCAGPGGMVLGGNSRGLVSAWRAQGAALREGATAASPPSPLAFLKPVKEGSVLPLADSGDFGSALAAAIATRKGDLAVAFAPSQGALQSKVEGLRQRLLGLLEKNMQKPELERLDRDEFILDLAEKNRLLAQREEAIGSLKGELELKILANQFLRNNIKQDAWNGMDPVGKTLFAFDGPLEVSNYAQPKVPRERMEEIESAKRVRKIEMAETRLRRQKEEHDSGVERPADDEEVEEDVLYTPLQLTTSQRKRTQVLLLEDQIREKRKVFNKHFEDMFGAKIDSIRKIQEKNQRIHKICAELHISEATEDPSMHVLETPEKLLEVADDEVKVPRVYTAAELAAQAEVRRLEEERLAAMARDNPHERGVQDMMRGRLEDQTDEDIWIDPPRPGFLDDVKKDDWTEEQGKQAAEFASTMKELEDLRDKRRKALDAELRKLQEQIQALRKGFDVQLQQLFEDKLRTEQHVCCDELYIAKLIKAVQEDEDLLEEDARLQAVADDLKDRIVFLEGQIGAAQQLVDRITDDYNNVSAADRLMDKQFRQHRDFADHGAHVEALYKLFKRRPKVRKVHDEVDVPPLDRAADCPDGLDERAWERLVALRDEKIESEALVRERGTELAEANSFLSERRAEEQQLQARIADTLERIAALREERHRNSLDADVLLVLKQGQLEVSQVCDYDPDFSKAALVDKAFVAELNDATKSLAHAKIAHLQDLMEKRKGVRQLEWDHRYLELENEMLQDKTKEIQLFRVTKSAVSGKMDPKKEVDALERSKAASRKAFERTLEDKQRTVKKLKASIRKK